MSALPDKNHNLPPGQAEIARDVFNDITRWISLQLQDLRELID